jgi:opacity protein-like surface antigen
MHLRLLTLALFLAVPAAHAQFAVLPYVGYDLDAETAVFGLGAEVALPLATPVGLSVRPSGEYLLIRDIDIAGRTFQQIISQLNLDVIVRFGTPGLQPFAGAGVSVRSIDLDTSDNDDVEGDQDITETNVGANLLGGAEFGAGALRPFLQGRLTLSDGSVLSFLGGVVFRF